MSTRSKNHPMLFAGVCFSARNTGSNHATKVAGVEVFSLEPYLQLTDNSVHSVRSESYRNAATLQIARSQQAGRTWLPFPRRTGADTLRHGYFETAWLSWNL